MPKSIIINDNFKLAAIWRELQVFPTEELYFFVPAIVKNGTTKLRLGVPDSANIKALNDIDELKNNMSDAELKNKLKEYPFKYEVKTNNNKISDILNTLTENFDDDKWVMDNFRSSNIKASVDHLPPLYWAGETVRIFFKQQQDINLLNILLTKSKH